MALFPAILFLLAIARFFPLSDVADDIGRSLGPVVSPQILELIQDQMRACQRAVKACVANSTDYNGAYGTVGGVIVLPSWAECCSAAFGIDVSVAGRRRPR